MYNISKSSSTNTQSSIKDGPYTINRLIIATGLIVSKTVYPVNPASARKMNVILDILQ